MRYVEVSGGGFRSFDRRVAFVRKGFAVSVPLIAQVEDSTTEITGLGLVEDAELIASGIRDGSWVRLK